MWKECHEIICIVEDGIALHNADFVLKEENKYDDIVNKRFKESLRLG